MPLSIAVVIPAYNEEASIASVIDEIQRLTLTTNYRIQAVVINDNSTDRTADRKSTRLNSSH